MERIDLMNALRLVRDYCYDRETCTGCLIKKECEDYLETDDFIPEHWDLDDDK